MYVVTKVGVYLQDVFGPFESEGTAKVQAQLLAMDDIDDYHDWDVCFLGATGLGRATARYRKGGVATGGFRNGTACRNDEWEAYGPRGREAVD